MEKSNAKLVGALLIGAAIGAVATFFAMSKEGEIKKMITGKTEELSKSLKEKFTTLMEEAKEKYQAANEKASPLTQNGKGRL